MDTAEFFQTYVFGWMCEDIERELRWAKEGKPAGNALCALGLLSYTEFMATHLPPSRRPTGGARSHFDAFFRELGPSYADLIDRLQVNVYDVFRCGLAHEYFVKGNCTIAMLNSTPGDLEVKGPWDFSVTPASRSASALVSKPANCGLGLAPNGSYYFIVERYYQDFKMACERLQVELVAAQQPPTAPASHPSMLSSDGSPY